MVGLAVAIFWLSPVNCSAGELELNILDDATGKALPARVQLTGPRGRQPHPKGLPHFADHFVAVAEPTILQLAPGRYRYQISSGPEYLEQFGSFVMSAAATDNKTIQLKRFVDMKSQGWWSGDPWFARDVAEAPLIAAAEDLHLLAVLPKDADHTSGDENDTGALAQDSDDPAMDISGREPVLAGGSLHVFGKEARPHSQATDAAAWDFPAWVAADRVDSVIVLQPYYAREDASTHRPRDSTTFDGAEGPGRYRESIYHHLLNAGLRIPPAASSKSGHRPLAPGTHRTYVQLGEPFSASRWWQGLGEGQVVISNGPLMLPKVNDQFPGYVFAVGAGGSIELTSSLTLHTREKIDYLQFIKNGESVAEVRLDEWAKQGGELPTIKFDDSGWMIIRAVTQSDGEYRYAATGPYYVQIGDTPRISRRSAEFFLKWVYQRAKAIKQAEADHPEGLFELQRRARDFWKERVAKANAE